MGKVAVHVLLRQLVIQKNTIMKLKDGKKNKQVLSVAREKKHVQVESGMLNAMETHLVAYKLSHIMLYFYSY